MSFEEFMTALTDYAQNTGLILGDLTEDELYELLETAQAVVRAVHAELAAHPEEEA